MEGNLPAQELLRLVQESIACDLTRIVCHVGGTCAAVRGVKQHVGDSAFPSSALVIMRFK